MEKRKREQVVKGGTEKEDKLRLESNLSFCTLFDHRFFFISFTYASIYICMYVCIQIHTIDDRSLRKICCAMLSNKLCYQNQKFRF